MQASTSMVGACQELSGLREHGGIFLGQRSMPACTWMVGACQDLPVWREHTSICLGGGSMQSFVLVEHVSSICLGGGREHRSIFLDGGNLQASAWVVGACQHLASVLMHAAKFLSLHDLFLTACHVQNIHCAVLYCTNM